jgi:hypothetical protein
MAVWILYVEEFLVPSHDNVLQDGIEGDLGQHPSQTLSQFI